MKKVAVIGCPGSGKTVFSQKLHALTGLPLVHLDLVYHRMKGEATDEAEGRATWQKWVSEQVAKPEWIIDGNYKSTMDIRVRAADTIVYLDYPRATSLVRALKRLWRYRGKTRPDMPEEWKEHVTSAFLKFMWNYRRFERPKVLALLDSSSKGKDVHIFSKPAAAEKYLSSLIKD